MTVFRKILIKRAAALLPALAMAFALTACGGSADSRQTQKAQERQEEQKVQEPQKAQAGQELQEAQTAATADVAGQQSMGEEAGTKPSEGFTITDISGREVTFEKRPQTFVVANYILNFLLIGGGESLDKVVGLTMDGWEDTRYGEYTALTEAFPQIKEIRSIGGYHDDVLDRESILELAPDCLLINSSQYTENETSIPTWEAAGIKIVVLDYHKMKLENHLDSTKILGGLLGKEDVAQELCDRYSDSIQTVQERIASLSEEEKDIKVYVELGNAGVGEIGNSYDGMLWGAIIDNLGAKNIAAGKLPDSYGPLDKEYILEQDPDVIVIGGSIWSGDDDQDQMRMGFTIPEELAMERLAGFAGRDWSQYLSGIKKGEIYGVDHGSLRNILDYTFTVYLAKVLYPGQFGDMDPQTEYREALARYLPEVTVPGTFMIRYVPEG